MSTCARVSCVPSTISASAATVDGEDAPARTSVYDPRVSPSLAFAGTGV
jgi:hypothetical protein